MPDIAHDAAEAVFGRHHQENTMTTPAQPSVLAQAAAVLHDLDANMLASKLYEGGLGKLLQPHQVQTVIDFVTGLEAPHQTLTYTAPPAPQDGTGAQTGVTS